MLKFLKFQYMLKSFKLTGFKIIYVIKVNLIKINRNIFFLYCVDGGNKNIGVDKLIATAKVDKY